MTSFLLDGLHAEVAPPVLRAVTSGGKVMALALTEPRGSSGASHLAARVRPINGGFLVSGRTLGDAGRARDRRRHYRSRPGIAGDAPATGPPGRPIGLQRIPDPGFRPLRRTSLTFDDTFVPGDHQLVDGSSGLAAQLGDFGSPGQFMCIVPRAEAARWLCYRRLGLGDGLPHTREAAMVKWLVPHLAVQAINDCIVLHGHVGWSTEMPLQQLLLDVSGLQIGEGAPQIQNLVIARHLIARHLIARHLIGRQYTG